jgi:tetratricopeptide (TPR) repeat protein
VAILVILTLSLLGGLWLPAFLLPDGAQRLAQESLAFFVECGDRRGIAFALNNLGEIAAQRGDYAEAERFHRQSLVLRRASGDRWGIAYSLSQLGRVARLAGSPDEARAVLLEALRTARDGRALPLVLDVLTELAALHAAAGDADRALDLLYPVLRHPARTRRTHNTTALLLAGLDAQRRTPRATPLAGTAATVEEIVTALLAAGPVALHPSGW